MTVNSYIYHSGRKKMINIVTIGYRYEGLDDLFLNINISVRNAKYFLDNYDMFIDLAMANHVLYYMEANLEYPFTEDNSKDISNVKAFYQKNLNF